jgi:predicted nuclease with TOPRIM domain
MFDAMEAIGLDTLKATRTLQAAGFDAAQAEALVTVLGGPVLGNVATKEDVRDVRVDLRDLRSELKSDFDGLRSELKTEVDGLRSELKADIGQLREESTAMRGDVAQLGQGMADLRREMSEIRLQVRGHATKAQMYRLLLVQATVIVGLVVGLQQLL